MTLTRIALRELPAHRGRVALTVLSVLLGVAFVAGTLVFSATMEKGVESAFSEVGRGTDTVVRARKTVDGGLGDTERPVPASVLEAVANAPGVAKAHGAVTGFAAVLDRHGAIVEDAPQIGMNWTDDTDFSPLRLRSGAGPGADHEIAIDDGTAEKAGYRLGDRVRVALPGGVREFTLTGTFRFREAAVTAFTPAAAQRLLMERPGTYRQVAVHAATGISQEEVRDAVARVLPDGIEAITGRRSIEERTEEIKDLLRTLNLFVLAFAAVSLFVGSFLIFNTFAMLVAQRTRELALLRAVGAGRGQVTRLVLGEALAIGLLGSTLGLLSGIGLAALLPVFIPDVPSDGLSVPLSTVTAAYSVGLGVTLLAAYLPARRAARIPPVAALRDEEARPGLSGRGRLSAGSAAMVGGAVMIAIGLTATGSSAVGLAGGGAALVFLGVGGLSR